ncbi:MAG: diaminopimelate epimerase [Desulforegulaceae bacterium]|nr:diaminopimelate epimerase [Desulforegulaceae bacterium]
MLIKLSKMHGIGNDFILADDRKSNILNQIDYSSLAKKLCHRNFGLGADGFIVAVSSKTHDIGFKIFNSDGSEAEMCGNGMRCFAKYVYEKSILMQKIINVETKAGSIVPLLDINFEGIVENIKVDMGEPVFDPELIPCTLKKDRIISEKIEVLGNEVEITCVSMGNPHAVIFIENDIEDFLFFKLGPAIENFNIFPKKTNVEFVRIISENEISVRVWERGAGETLACGTGACACVAACVLNNKTLEEVVVRLKGGSLDIKWNRANNHIFKTGPAKFVYETEIELERIKNDL